MTSDDVYASNMYVFSDGSICTQKQIASSSIIGANSPYFANKILDSYKINDRGIGLGWFMSESFIKIGNINTGIWQLVFFILGFFSAKFTNNGLFIL